MTATPQRILVVDDDPEIRKLLARYIESQGFRVLLAASCAELRDRLATSQVDLIVLDVMLPGLSGIEVLEELRNDAALESIPVVVITAWSHAELDAQVAGADRFVSKPFDPDELSTAVQELLA